MRGRRTRPEHNSRQHWAVLIVCFVCCNCVVYDDHTLNDLFVAREHVDAGTTAAVPRAADAAIDATVSDAGDAGSAQMRPAPTTATTGTTIAPMDHGDPAMMDAGTKQRDADNAEQCPDDISQTVPALCGCDVPETCSALSGALAHRYRFEDVGDAIVDARGAAHGKTNSPLMGTSALTFAGSADSYATLPSRVLSAFSAVTIELWLTWSGGDPGQPVLSFGTAEPGAPNSMCTNAELWRGSWHRFCKADGKTTWWKARGLCEGANGALAAIESAAEHEHIISHAAFTESVWIGANDLQVEGQWYFANASGLQGGTHFWSGDEGGSAPDGAFERWRRDQPTPDDSDPDADCAFILKGNGAWTAFACDSNGSFLCEWRGHQGRSMVRGMAFTPSDNAGAPALTLQLGRRAVVVRGDEPFPTDLQTHVAIVLDAPAGTATLYLEGKQAASAAISGELGELRDIDNWIARSHVATEPGLAGSLAELRIYGRALTAQELAASHSAGPDPAFLE